MNKTITAQNAPAAVGPYCHAKLAGNTLYTSGQLGLIPATGELPEGVEAQAAQALDNLSRTVSCRNGVRRRGEDHRISGRYQRFCGYQRHLCQVLPRRSSSPLLRTGGCSAQGGPV